MASIVEEFGNFEDMGLSDETQRGIYSYGFEKPSVIQSKAIVPIINKHDVVAQSQSGTGKTGTFVIATLERVNDRVNGVQAIIVTPTRELAYQIVEVSNNIGQFHKIKTVACVGGSNMYDCRKRLDRGAIIAVGTPGRLIDMIDRKYLLTDKVDLLILDEADEMLSNNFKDQIKNIIGFIPKTAQICLFSATMPTDILELSIKFMNEPVNILVKTDELTLEGIQQYYIDVDNDKWKTETICDLYNIISINQSIIYVNSVKKAERLEKDLAENNFAVSIIHGKLKQNERMEVMRNFRNCTTRILISTDLLARGIDIQQVSIVINFELPNNKECYLHRIGRSGRFGRKGVAINFATNRDFWKIKELENFYTTVISPMPDPNTIQF